MTSYRRHLNQTGTYWPPGGNDGMGGISYGAPTTVDCRFQRKAVLFKTAEGKEETSSAIAYTATELEIGGYFYLGESVAADPKSVAGAFEIRGHDESPNLKNTDRLHKAYL